MGTSLGVLLRAISRKCVYLGHRRFLPNNHSFRSLKKVFNNEIEKEEPPKYLTGEDILKLVDDIDYKSGKHKGSKRKRDDCDDDSNKLFKRKSFFLFGILATFVSSSFIRWDTY